MDKNDFQNFLYAHTPLARAMDISVAEVKRQSIILSAPLGANKNMHGTVFGGSGAVMATLAAWAMVYTRLTEAGLTDYSLVIYKGETTYEKPMKGKFSAVCQFDNEPAWQAFINQLRQSEKANILMPSKLICEGVTAVKFVGEFVAFKTADQK